MNTVTTKTRKVKPSTRSLRISDAINGVRTLVITQDAERVFYNLAEVRCEIGGRGFRLDKCAEGTGSDEGEAGYDVHVGGSAGGSCTCKGHTYHRHNKPCKHLAAVLFLVGRGTL